MDFRQLVVKHPSEFIDPEGLNAANDARWAARDESLAIYENFWEWHRGGWWQRLCMSGPPSPFAYYKASLIVDQWILWPLKDGTYIRVWGWVGDSYRVDPESRKTWHEVYVEQRRATDGDVSWWAKGKWMVVRYPPRMSDEEAAICKALYYKLRFPFPSKPVIPARPGQNSQSDTNAETI